MIHRPSTATRSNPVDHRQPTCHIRTFAIRLPFLRALAHCEHRLCGGSPLHERSHTRDLAPTSTYALHQGTVTPQQRCFSVGFHWDQFPHCDTEAHLASVGDGSIDRLEGSRHVPIVGRTSAVARVEGVVMTEDQGRPWERRVWHTGQAHEDGQSRCSRLGLDKRARESGWMGRRIYDGRVDLKTGTIVKFSPGCY